MKEDEEVFKKLKDTFLTTMLKNLPELIFVKNTDLIYVCASQAFASMVGLEDAEEIIGKTDADLFKDKDLVRRYNDDDYKLLQQGKALEGYIEPSTANGIRGYYQTSKYPLYDEDGELAGLYAVSKDVTKEYKAKLNYEQELRTLFELPENAIVAALFDVTNWRIIELKIVGELFGEKIFYESIDNVIKKISAATVIDEKSQNFYDNFSRGNLRRLFERGKRYQILEYRMKLSDGTVHWVRMDLHFLLDPVNGNLCAVWILRDIEKQKQQEVEKARDAEVDALTNLYNRKATMTYIQNFLDNEGLDGTHWLFMIDVDNFKLINDNFGHLTGDETLMNIAATIRRAFRETDIVGRIGGDEFFALMKDIEDRRMVGRRAKDLVEALQYICAEDNLEVDLSGSVGISRYVNGDKTLEQLYAEADVALYRAKSTGKNCFAFAEGAAENGYTTKEPISAIHLRTLLENMGATMFQTELSDNGEVSVNYCSHNLFSKKGGEAKESTYETLWDAILLEDLEVLKDQIKQATEKGVDLDHICRIWHDGGELQWCHIRGTHPPKDYSHGRRMIHVATDVTKQKEIESELREKDNFIDFAMRNTDVNLWRFDYEKAECQLTPSCQKVHEMIGVEILEDFPNSLFEMGYVREDCIELLRNAYEELQKTGKSLEFDAWYRKGDGSGWWCERDMISPLFDAEGRVVRGIGIGKNVTAEKELEEKFHAFQSYRFLAKNSTLASVRMNLTTGWCGDYLNNEFFPQESSDDHTVENFFQTVLERIPDKEELKEVEKLSREYLREAFFSGVSSVTVEHRYRKDEKGAIWIRTVIDMMKNPMTSDVEALYYTIDIDHEKNMGLVVEQLLSDDYEFFGLVDAATEQLMVFGESTNSLNKAIDGGNYGEEIPRLLKGFVLDEYYDESVRTMSCSHIVKELKDKEAYICSFPVAGEDAVRTGRKQWRYSYLDAAKSKILVTRVDITHIYTAERDPLTGLYNRESFYRKTRGVLLENKDCPFILIRFDIDRFKAYNDVCGVSEGDRLLAGLGTGIRARIWPKLAIFGRLEADHFVALLPAAELHIADWVELQNGFSKNIATGYRLTFSVGIYEIQNHDMDISLMCDRALLALRTVKDSYTHKMAWYNESLRDKLMMEQNLIDEMEEALKGEQFVIYFQPQVDYQSGAIVSVEALVRWLHPKHGIIPPNDFIPIFEKNGFILKLDYYVWAKSCEYLRDWLDEHSGLEPVPVSVNISRCDLYDSRLCEKLLGLVEKYKIPVSMLKLEITETAYMEVPEQLIGVVNKLREMGFTVEMDDFGAGYSSLNMLKDVPVDVLKLDTRFLSESEHNQRAITILNAIIHMALDLNLSVIAEGVETKEQADYLSKMNCHIMQGYYFGRPMPAEQFEKLIHKSF